MPLTVLVFWHDGVAESEETEEHVDVRIPCLHRIPESFVVETELRFIHRIVGKVHLRSVLQRKQTA